MKTLQGQSTEEKGLSNWVFVKLKEAILSGYFEAGEKLDQAQIAEDLQVSRTPIREALKVLASEGYVEIRSYRGAYIPMIQEQDVHDVYEVRWVIESEMARQSTMLIPDEELMRLEKLLEKGVFDPKVSTDRWHYEIDQEFHDTIASYCQNKLFREILDNLNNRIVRVRSFALRQSGAHLDASHVEHNLILAAVMKRDPEEAAKTMEQHLRNSAQRITTYLSQNPPRSRKNQ